MLRLLAPLALLALSALPAAGQDIVPDEILVKLRPAAHDVFQASRRDAGRTSALPALDAAGRAVGAVEVRPVLPLNSRFAARHRASGMDRWYVVRFDRRLPPQAVAETYAALDAVEVAEVQYVRRLYDADVPFARVEPTPEPPPPGALPPVDDPMYPQQWHYDNTGQWPGSAADTDIDLPEAWATGYTGAGVVVAVLDTGSDLDHPDLAASLWTNPGEVPGNGLDDDGNGYVDDVYGIDPLNGDSDPSDDNDHGTHTAGTIAAVTGNGVGVAGIAPGARIMTLKMCSATGLCHSEAVIGESFVYAADMGAAITSNSWNFGPPRTFIENAIAYFNANGGGGLSAGGLTVFANGNGNLDCVNPAGFSCYPASYPFVVSVAAVGYTNARAWYSSYGVGTTISAPGGDQLLSSPQGGVLSTVRDGYAWFQGTSMATPHVSGVAALVVQANVGATPGAIRARLTSTAGPVNDPQYTAGKMGAGLVNAAAALAGAGPPPPPPGPPAASVSPLSFDVTVGAGTSTTAPLDIANTAGPGSRLLSWSASIEAVTAFASLAPGSGHVAAGSSQAPVVTFDAAGLPPGIHTATLHVTTSDPANPTYEIPITLSVLPPVASVTPASVSATVATGGTTTATVTVANTAASGAGDLTWSATLAGVDTSPTGCSDGQSLTVAGGVSFGVYTAFNGAAYGQSFTAPCDGRLTALQIPINGGTTLSGHLRLYEGGGTGGVQIAAAPFSDVTASTLTVAFPAPVAVRAGHDYTWFLDLTNGFGTLANDVTAGYAGGTAYVASNGEPASAVPQPSDLYFTATFAPASWVAIAPPSGTVAAGASAPLGVTFDAAGLADGTYTADLIVSSNDPATPTTTVPLTLHVGAPTGAFAFVQPTAGQAFRVGGWLKAIWDSPAPAPETVVLSLRRGAGPYEVLYTGPNLERPDFGAARWRIPVGTPAGDDYSVRIEDAADAGTFAVSDAFSITDPGASYAVALPADRLAAGAPATITWTAPAGASGTTVTLTLLDRATRTPQATLSTADDGSESFLLPASAAPGPYLLSLADDGNPAYTGQSATFRVAAVAVSSPLAGATYLRGETLPVRWDAPSLSDPAATVRILIRHPSLPTTVVASATENDGAFDVVVPPDVEAATGYVVTVHVTSGGTRHAGKSGAFTVHEALVPPSPTAHFVPSAMWGTDASTLTVSAPGVADGTELGVFWGPRLVGAGVVRGGAAEVLVRGSILVPALVVDGVPSADDFVPVPDGAALSLRAFANGAEQDVEAALSFVEGSETSVTIAGAVVPVAPDVFSVLGVRPNPSSSAAVVRFTSPSAQPATVVVYDLLGRVVWTPFSGEAVAGLNEVSVPTRALPAGVYVVRVTAGAESAAARFTVVR